MKRDFLEGLGLEKDVVDKILDENSRDIGREKQKADQAKEDLAAVQQQLADRDKETEAYKTQIADRDYSDAVHKAISEKGIKFSSKAAERAYISDLKAKHLELKEGVLTGFDDWHKAQEEADPSAFQSGKPSPTFSKPVGSGGAPASEGKGAMYAKQFNAQYAQTTTKE